MRVGRLFAVPSVKLDIDGVPIEIDDILPRTFQPAATRIELPTYRDSAGRSQTAIVLPEEVRGPIGDVVLDHLVECGLTKRRFSNAA